MGAEKITQDIRLTLTDFYQRTLPDQISTENFQLHVVSDGHGQFGHHVSYFIEVNLPLILKKNLKAAMDEYSKFESGTYVPATIGII